MPDNVIPRKELIMTEEERHAWDLYAAHALAAVVNKYGPESIYGFDFDEQDSRMEFAIKIAADCASKMMEHSPQRPETDRDIKSLVRSEIGNAIIELQDRLNRAAVDQEGGPSIELSTIVQEFLRQGGYIKQ